MIIECPACATRYEVPDGAIGAAGRNVRCAKCKHSWHATGVEDVEVDADRGSIEPAATPKASARKSAARPLRGARDSRAAEGRPEEQPAGRAEARQAAPPPRGLAAAARGAAGWAGEGAYRDTEPPGETRGGSRRLWTWAAVILTIMVAATIAATALWGMPDWVPGGQESFAAEPDLVLDFPDDQQGMRQLPNGTEFFGASGTVTNTGSTTKRVPPILIVLRDSRERIVYSFEVVPPKHRLAPGESMAVSEAVTEVPRSARVADIGWKPG